MTNNIYKKEMGFRIDTPEIKERRKGLMIKTKTKRKPSRKQRYLISEKELKAKPNSKHKGKYGENLVEREFNKFSDFIEVFPEPGSGSRSNKKYKQDFYIRITIGDLTLELKDENKFYKRIAIFRWWDKLIATLHRGSNYIPAMTLKENYSDILFTLKLIDWLGILRDLKDEIDKRDERIKCLEGVK